MPANALQNEPLSLPAGALQGGSSRCPVYAAQSERTTDVKAFATRTDALDYFEDEVERCTRCGAQSGERIHAYAACSLKDFQVKSDDAAKLSSTLRSALTIRIENSRAYSMRVPPRFTVTIDVAKVLFGIAAILVALHSCGWHA
jgi:hypothetical protein